MKYRYWLVLLLAGMLSVAVAKAQTEGRALDVVTVLQDKEAARWVEKRMKHMSLKEKVGQLFVYTVAPVNTRQNRALLETAVCKYKVGGLLFSGGRMENQVGLTNLAQKKADIPLMITFDGEWGLSMRLKGTPVFPRNMVLGCIQNNDLIYEYGREMARQCRLLGVTVNFAPVADVNINPDNPVIGTRSFGENPRRVAEKVVAYASGLESGGVISVSKHFPGHGDTNVDSHKALPVLDFGRSRLDSVELRPFREAIRAGVNGIMVGHLQVPALEPEKGRSASLSRRIVSDLLAGELGYRGLVFTDALAMKGVSRSGDRCLQALIAGNDVVLAPSQIKQEFEAVVSAVKKGEVITEEDIDRKCRKVLLYKYALGLSETPHVQLSGLMERIHTEQTDDLIRRLNLAAVTVAWNRQGGLPLRAEAGQPIALLQVGEGNMDTLSVALSRYVPLVRFRLAAKRTPQQEQALKDSLEAYRHVIVAVGSSRLKDYASFFSGFSPSRPALFLCFASADRLLPVADAVRKASAVVIGHTLRADVQRRVADVLFGKAVADGRLPAAVGSLFREGDGVTIGPETLLTSRPEDCGLSSLVLSKIDSIAVDGIRQGAYPGCQVVVMKDGRVVVDKAFGTYAGEGSAPVTPRSVYDLASLSKTTGTVLALMHLYDKGLFSLDDRLSEYLPFLKKGNKKHLTIREVLFHQSGLPAGLLFYREAVDGKALRKQKRIVFDSRWVSPVKDEKHTVQAADSIWLSPDFRKEVERKIVSAPLKDKRYRYSDVGFVLLGMLAEELAGMPLDVYLQREFYDPMGLAHTAYCPLRYMEREEVVPSSVDHYLHRKVVRGFVHDESAAFLGGVAGNAGLFSTALEVAQVYQMLVDGGEWDGRRYLSEETVRLFTTGRSGISRRGLGFDRPDARVEKSPCAPSAPLSVFGHIGFTGTCAWADPDNKLVYVFLSNRIYPSVSNRKLMRLKIRSKIQEVVYEALKQGKR